MKKYCLLIVLLLSLSIIVGFGATPTTVRPIDKQYYISYQAYCNTKVLDTCLIVGIKTIPLVKVGLYWTQKRTFKISMYSNRSRMRTYKNVNKIITTLPKLTSTTAIAWSPISYYCLQRKILISDFYNWYWLQILKKPKFWT